jgi:hypothetical protein
MARVRGEYGLELCRGLVGASQGERLGSRDHTLRGFIVEAFEARDSHAGANRRREWMRMK